MRRTEFAARTEFVVVPLRSEHRYKLAQLLVAWLVFSFNFSLCCFIFNVDIFCGGMLCVLICRSQLTVQCESKRNALDAFTKSPFRQSSHGGFARFPSCDAGSSQCRGRAGHDRCFGGSMGRRNMREGPAKQKRLLYVDCRWPTLAKQYGLRTVTLHSPPLLVPYPCSALGQWRRSAGQLAQLGA